MTVGMHKEDERRFGNLSKTPCPCHLHRRLAPLRLFGGLGARPGIEQRQLDHPFRRLTHDFKGDIAAHRQTGEREAGRRGGQDAGGDRLNGIVAGVIGDGDRTEPP